MYIKVVPLENFQTHVKIRAQFFGRKWSVLRGFSAVKFGQIFLPANFLGQLRQTCHFDANILTYIPLCNRNNIHFSIAEKIFQ